MNLPTPPDILATIEAMRREGRTAAEIAAAIPGRTIEQIRQLTSRYHIVDVAPPAYNGFWTPLRVDVLRDMAAEQTHTASEIGRDLGCSRNAVVGKAARLHIALRPPSGAPQRANGKTHRRASKRFLASNIPPVVGEQIKDLPVEPTSETWIRFTDRRPDQCAWPCEGEGYLMLVCGAARWHDGTAYCQAHHQRGHTGYGRPPK